MHRVRSDRPFGERRRLMAGHSQSHRARREVAERQARANVVVEWFEGSWLPVHEYMVSAASGPGLYGVWLPRKAWDEMGLRQPPRVDGGWVYVGKAERSVNSRALKTHMGYSFGCTGRSSFRRTLVALLRDRLDLEVMPRNPAKPGHYDRYGLDSRDEWELGCWINGYAVLAGWPSDRSRPLVEVEADVIATMKPPFNLTHARTKWAAHIKAERAKCAAIARDWAVSRGLHPGTSPWSDPPGP
jgi:hypothetical protein